jgi:protein-tyrosine-phosphatase
MAAALTDHLAHGRVHVRSAGSMPAADLNPAVIQAMQEIGVDIGQAFPKPLTDDVVRAADVVVTMGCGDACPLYPGKQYQDWELDDPGNLALDEVRRIRDEIRDRVSDLLASLDVRVT